MADDVDVVEAVTVANRWWRKRTGTDVVIARRCSRDFDVDVEPHAVKTLVMYATNMSAVAERRRRRIIELKADVETLQRAMFAVGRDPES